MSEENICSKCKSDYEEHYYQYNNRMFCFDCLVEELESEGKLNIVNTVHYYNENWRNLGTDDEMLEVIQNICEEYEVQEI